MTRFYAGIGSRQTPIDILTRMKSIAEMLAQNGWTLRSGAAKGADQWFEAGAGTRKEIFRARDATHEARVHARKYHPAWHKLSDEGRLLHARNSMTMLGRELDSPVKFICCWTRDGKATGGTGQGLRIAEGLDIPVFNLYYSMDEGQLIEFLGDSK